MENKSEFSATNIVRNFLGEKIKCSLDDGRSVTGTFICVDRLTNLILTNAIEERTICSSDYSDAKHEKLLTTRKLSQVMIPGERLIKVEIDKLIYDSKVDEFRC